MTHLYIDLYTGKSKLMNAATAKEHIEGCERKKGDKIVYICEEYLIVEL